MSEAHAAMNVVNKNKKPPILTLIDKNNYKIEFNRPLFLEYYLERNKNTIFGKTLLALAKKNGMVLDFLFLRKIQLHEINFDKPDLSIDQLTEYYDDWKKNGITWNKLWKPEPAEKSTIFPYSTTSHNYYIFPDTLRHLERPESKGDYKWFYDIPTLTEKNDDNKDEPFLSIYEKAIGKKTIDDSNIIVNGH